MSTSSRAFLLCFAWLGLVSAGSAQGPTWSSLQAWPDARSEHAMAYDEGRARTLLFGGRDGATLFGDTWEWDGEAWARFSPAASPSPRWGHAMAYDLGRGVTVLFGGCDAAGPLGDTWEWDGHGWRQIVTANAPSPRHEHAMAGWVLYPSLDSHVVLFSGFRSNSNSYVLDTWTFDGTNWTVRQGPGPQARKNAAMARSSTYGLAVLTGGYWGGTTQSDCWGWNGQAWTQLANGPQIHSHAMAFDHNLGAFITVGGNSGAGPVTNCHKGTNVSTYAIQWNVQPQAAPVAERAAATYDTRRSWLVSFGGLTAQGAANTLHEADYALNWQQRTVFAGGPSRRSYSAMAYHPGHGKTYLFGGLDEWAASPTTLGDTWVHDENGWSQPGFSVGAQAVQSRRGHAMVHFPHPNGTGLVMYGGYDDVTGTRLNDIRLLTYIALPGYLGWSWSGAGPWSIALTARSDHTMVYDSARGRVLIFGGYGTSGPSAELFEMHYISPAHLGATPVVTNGSPGARYSHAMAYDSRRHRSVLFGGADGGQFRGDTWEYDSGTATWTQVATTGPSPRVNCEMGFDEARGVVVMTGGRDASSTLLYDVWEWNGVAWRQRDVTSAWPSPREGHAMTYDPTTRRFLLFGGRQQDTSMWALTADVDRFADGMQGGSSPLRCTQFPVAGRETGFAFDSPFGFGWFALGFGAAPVPALFFDPPIACGSRGFVFPVQPIVVPVGGSPARITFTLPPNMAGIGLTLQGLSLDLGQSCVRFTDPLAVTIAP